VTFTSNAPDYIEPIVGYRVWRFCEARINLLHSLSLREIWCARQAAEAVCFALPLTSKDNRSHLAPTRDCSCGIWAIRNQRRAARLMTSLVQRPLMHLAPIVNLVWGEVVLWGHVIEHQHGYRAQYAYPRLFYVPTHFRTLVVEPGVSRTRRVRAPEAAQMLSDFYGVEAVVGEARRFRPRAVPPGQQRLFE